MPVFHVTKFLSSASQKAAIEKYATGTLPDFLPKLEKQVGEDGYFHGGKVRFCREITL